MKRKKMNCKNCRNKMDFSHISELREICGMINKYRFFICPSCGYTDFVIMDNMKLTSERKKEKL